MKKSLLTALAKTLHTETRSSWAMYYTVEQLEKLSPFKAARVQSGKCGLNHYRSFLRKHWRKGNPAQRWANCIKAVMKPVEQPNEITIQFDYSSSRIYGVQMKATVRVSSDQWRYDGKSGYTSGCGYDKLSTAAAAALNGCTELRQWLLQCALSGHAFGYGMDATTPSPAFRAGVGINCLEGELKALGFAVREIYSPRKQEYQAIIFERK